MGWLDFLLGPPSRDKFAALVMAELRKLGGALFGDRRYGRVFIYHNGAQSYYSGRGFRGCLEL